MNVVECEAFSVNLILIDIVFQTDIGLLLLINHSIIPKKLKNRMTAFQYQFVWMNSRKNLKINCKF